MNKREAGQAAKGLLVGMGIGILLMTGYAWATDYTIIDRVIQGTAGFAAGAAGSAVLVIDASGNLQLADDLDLELGGSTDAILNWNTAQTQHALTLGLSGSNSFIIMDKADIETDLLLSTQTYASLFIVDADEDNVLQLSHSGDDSAFIGSKTHLLLRPGTDASDVIKVQAYDVDGAAYDDIISVTSGNTPTITVASDGALTFNTASLDGLAGDAIICCGDLVNTSTTYLGPVVPGEEYSGTDYSPNGAGCAALDNTTEATADAPVFVNSTFKITAMVCKVPTAAAGNIVFTARTAAGDTTPAITCTVATGEYDCIAQTSTTTDIAANATICVKAVSAADESGNDGWCKLLIAPQS